MDAPGVKLNLLSCALRLYSIAWIHGYLNNVSVTKECASQDSHWQFFQPVKATSWCFNYGFARSLGDVYCNKVLVLIRGVHHIIAKDNFIRLIEATYWVFGY